MRNNIYSNSWPVLIFLTSGNKCSSYKIFKEIFKDLQGKLLRVENKRKKRFLLFLYSDGDFNQTWFSWSSREVRVISEAQVIGILGLAGFLSRLSLLQCIAFEE